jgi:hypothetical protein
MITVKTKTGSTYLIDPVNVQWQRVEVGENSTHTVRSAGGKLYFLPRLEVGEKLTMVCPPMKQGSDTRVIKTSEIAEIDWGENDPLQYSNGSFETKNAGS